MNKTLFKIISIFLVVTHLLTISFKDACYAAPAKASTTQKSSGTTSSGQSSNAKSSSPQSSSNSGSSNKPPLMPSSTNDNLALQNKITSGAGFNLFILQSFQNDPFTGKASFSLPISVFPGRHGIQPNISLTYSSGQGNGILGIGWDLNLGSIERSTKRGVPKYDPTDTFVFNSGSPTELVYTGGNNYRAKLEGSFLKYSFDGSSWVVTDKQGTKYYFGQSYDSRQESENKVCKWYLDKVKDVLGNYLSITYIKDENQLYPKRIDYTANDSTNDPAFAAVVFEYADSRPDPLLSYRSGFKVVTNKRLTDIRAYFQDTLLCRYHLDYTQNESNRSLLTSTTQYGSDDKTTLPTVTFDYTDFHQPTLIWQKDDSWDISNLPEFYDGNDRGVRPVDINNDGLIDIVQALGGRPDKKVFLNKGPSLKRWEEVPWELPFTFLDVRHLGNTDVGRRFAYLYADGNDKGPLFVIKSFQGTDGKTQGACINNLRGRRFEDVSLTLPKDLIFSLDHQNYNDSGHDFATTENVALCDVNADGYSDIIKPGAGTYLYQEREWLSSPAWLIAEGSLINGSTQFAELNADGLTDFAIIKSSSKTAYLNTGSGWENNSSFSPPNNSDINFEGSCNQFVDINSDGLADIVISDDSTKKTYLNCGGNDWAASEKFTLPDGVKLNNSGARIIDVNADNLPDIIKRDNSSTQGVWINQAKPTGLLTQISNGIGGSVSITYKPSTEFDNKTAEGINGLPFPVYVVDSVTIHDGVNPQSLDVTTRYEYKGGLFDFSEREFRGFREVKSIDAEGSFSLTYFYQDPTYKGRPYLQETRDASGRLYSALETNWGKRSADDFVYLASSKSAVYGENGSVDTVNKEFPEYDAFGNLKISRIIGSVYKDKAKTLQTTTQTTEYAYSTDSYIVSLPKHTYIETDGVKSSESWFYYDNRSDVDASPTKGQLTKKEAWLYNPLTKKEERVPAQYSYDNCGNLTSSTDANSHTTTTTYDSKYHLYPVKLTNAKGHTTESVYYSINEEPYRDPRGITGFGLPGQLKYTKDPNNQPTYNIYDSLGRPTALIGPKDTLKTPGTAYKYDLTSTPIKITKAIKLNYGAGTNQCMDIFTGVSLDDANRYYNGTSDYVSFPDSRDFNFGTIDCWVKPSTASGSQMIFGQFNSSSAQNAYMALFGGGQYPVQFVVNDGKSNLINLNSGMSLSANTWYHIAVVRRWETWSLYIDGKLKAERIYSITYPDYTGDFVIGGNPYHPPEMYFSGQIEGFRVTKTALWTREFTPLRNDTATSIKPTYLFVYQFLDGLSRVLQTKTPAQNDSDTGISRQVISGSITYDKRGKVKEKYLPYFSEKSANYTTPSYDTPHAAFTYDSLGRLTRTTNPDASYETAVYNGNVTASIDENGHKTIKYSDSFGRLYKVEEYKGADGRSDKYPYEPYELYASTYYEYDPLGNLSKVIDSHNNTTEIIYDSLGRKLKMNDPDMGEWSYKYDSVGNLTKQTDAKGQVLEFYYDAINRLTGKLANQKTIADYNYDQGPNSIGRLSQVRYPFGSAYLFDSTQFFYDELGRETKSIKTIDGRPYEVSREYDAVDNLTKLTYPDGEAVDYVYDPNCGQLVSVLPSPQREEGEGEGAISYVKNIIYTPTGQIEQIKYGNGAETYYDYNPKTLRLNWLYTQAANQPFSLQFIKYHFDSGGNITNIVEEHGSYKNRQDFQYDHLSRLVRADGNYGSFTYDYDEIGNMTNKEGLSLQYGIPGANRLPHAVTRYGGISIDYDKNGNISRKRNLAFSYDSENRLVKVEDISMQEESSYTLTFKQGWNFFSLPCIPKTYKISELFSSLKGKFIQISRYNPSAKRFESYIASQKFDDFDSLEYGRGYQVYINSPEEATLVITGTKPKVHQLQLKAGYNFIGSLEDKTISPNTEPLSLKSSVDYDKLLGYDKSTNRLLRYPNGSLTEISSSQAYYIKCNKDTPLNIGYKGPTTTFAYDGDGGRVKKTTLFSTASFQEGEDQGEGAASTTYIGSLYEEEVKAEGSRVYTKHIFAGSNRVCSITIPQGGEDHGEGVISYYHSDHLGSSNVITDAQGKSVGYTEFTPFGSTFRQTGTSIPNHKFTGKELDSSTGLYFYGARYYDPQLGRFTSADTIVQSPYNPQSLNRYSYCLNNPINYTDPTGHWSWKKFWNSFAGAFLGAVVSVITGGLGAPLWLAGMYGGIAGGALTGGLEGGWKGALIGAGIGGALGGLGGWGLGIAQAHKMTGQFIAGALIAGAGVAAATDSWDSFAGGLTGGIAGAAVGTGFVNTEQFKNWKAGEGFVSNRTAAVNQARAERALNVNVAEDPVTVKTYWRGLEGKNGKPSGPRVHPFMEDWQGNYHELDVNKGTITIREGDITKMSRATQAYMATGPKPDEVTKVYGSEFFKAISQYKADRVGDPYHILKPTLDPIADNCIGFKEYVIDSSRVQ